MTSPTVHVWLGTGLMGHAMVSELEGAGHHLSVYNRTLQKTAGLKSRCSDILPEVLSHRSPSGAIFCMLSDGSAVEKVLEQLPSWKEQVRGATFVCMATVGSAQTRAFAEKCHGELGMVYVEAPVLGSISEIRAHRLQIMLSAADPAVGDSLLPVLSVLGPVHRVGTQLGASSVLKLALNNLIAGLTVTFSTSLSLIESNSIDRELFMNILRPSAFFAPTYEKKWRKYTHEEPYGENVTFSLRNMHKDAALIVNECKGSDVYAPNAQMNEDLLRAAFALQGPDVDYSVVKDLIRNSDHCHAPGGGE